MKKVLIIVSVIAVCLFIAGAVLNKKFGFIQTNETAQRIYTRGLDDIKNGDLQNAYFNFSKISKYNEYYEAALFRQGLIATELNDNESAIKAYETLLYKFPNTYFAEKSIYNLAVAYFNLNQTQKAYANFKLITKKYSNSDYADASNYFLGVLAKDTDKKTAAEHFINYINIAPNGKYALLSIKELTELKEDFTEQENIAIGQALLKNNMAKESLSYFLKAKFEDVWAYLSIAYKKTGDNKSSKQIFEKGIVSVTINNSDIQEEAVENYASFFRNRIQGLNEAKSLCDKANCQINDYIMYNLISSVDAQKKTEYYNRIFEEFPKGDYAADALFNSMFNDYINGSYDNAIIKGKKHNSMYSSKKSAPAAIYWLAKSYEAKKNTVEANGYYNKILTNYPDSYYAYLAAAKNNKIQNPYDIKSETKVPTSKINIDFPIIYANLPINSASKTEKLLDVKDYKIFEYADFDNEIVKSWVAYYEGNVTKAAVIAEKVLNKKDMKPPFDDNIYKLIYPIAYADIINKYSGASTKISPYLLLSLIKQESLFNPEAQSSVGALGLTQLMPDTALYIAGLSGMKYNKNELFDPEYNIKLGANYYGYIKSNHHSKDLFALASYNGGHGAVSKWIDNMQTNNLDEFVEKIPYPETRDYVKQIYRNYWVYNCIYNSSRVK
ncbi:transglycosylase SLT domain-containing protein [bacterium]|nr:transglycosylase SLT domain-containing protein [bacterium]